MKILKSKYLDSVLVVRSDEQMFNQKQALLDIGNPLKFVFVRFN